MKSLCKVALGLTVGLGVASLAGSPAFARKEAPTAGPGLPKAERTALASLKAALDARDYPGAVSALNAAQASVRSADGRYYLAVMQVEIARGTNNLPLLSSSIETLLASGRLTPVETGSLYASQGAIAALANERQRAEAAYSKAMEMAPTADVAVTLAQFRIVAGRYSEAVALVQRAIDLRKASSQPVPESWYRRGIVLAAAAKQGPDVLRFNREWIEANPSPENWRDAILTYRDYAKPDAAALVDAIRLDRMARGLAGERDYLEAAQTFSAAGLPGEAKSVFEEGVSARNVDPAKATFKEAIVAAGRDATAARPRLASLRSSAASAAAGAPAMAAADQLLSFGDYAGAADLYRVALQKGGDADVANTRLGIALALGGRRAEADAAFHSVAGPRSELASLWLIWLAQRS